MGKSSAFAADHRDHEHGLGADGAHDQVNKVNKRRPGGRAVSSSRLS